MQKSADYICLFSSWDPFFGTKPIYLYRNGIAGRTKKKQKLEKRRVGRVLERESYRKYCFGVT